MFTKDTIRLVVAFRDFNGHTINPTDIKLTIFDADEAQLELIETNIIRDTDKYYYDYVSQQDFTFEFSGIHNGLPVLARQFVKTKFV